MKTRIAFTTLMILLLIPQVFAEGPGSKEKNKNREAKAMVSLSGTVVDGETGEGLAGVTVKIDGTETVVYTDFDGNFSVAVAPGSYTVSTKLISYESSELKVEAGNKQENLKITLENLSKKR